MNCVYCNELSQSGDHIVPITTLMAPRGYTALKDTLPCCLDCNRRLSSFIHADFKERCHLLFKKLLVLAKQYEHLPDWTQEEMSELSPNLRTHVEYTIQEKLRTDRRIGALKQRFSLDLP